MKLLHFYHTYRDAMKCLTTGNKLMMGGNTMKYQISRMRFWKSRICNAVAQLASTFDLHVQICVFALVTSDISKSQASNKPTGICGGYFGTAKSIARLEFGKDGTSHLSEFRTNLIQCALNHTVYIYII